MKTTITREGIYYLFVVLVVLVGSIIREINPMLLFSAFLTAPLIIAWRLGRRSLRGIRMRRILPPQIFSGEPFIIQLELTKHSPRRSLSSWGIIVIDRIRPDLEYTDEKKNEPKPYEPAVYFEYVPDGGTVKKTYAGRIPQRGRYRVGPAEILTRFPFGFFRHRFEQAVAEDEKSHFLVYPKLGRISRQWSTRHHEAIESQHRRRFRPSRISGEFLGVRRWQSGDAKKWIHWRASAKHREPFVRQFEKNQNRDCAILIDLFAGDEGEGNVSQIDFRESFELAVSFTATLVSEMTRRGGCNLFFASSRSGNQYFAGPVSMPLTENILQQLALAEPDPNDELPAALLNTLLQIDPSADLILVSPRPLDLAASPRFQEVKNDPRFRVVLQRLRVIDTSHPDLDRIFRIDDQ